MESNMTKQRIVVTQESPDDGCTGVVGVFTTYDRALAVRNRLNATEDGYKYELHFSNEDPNDTEF
jgi:hypothetical protein